MAKITIITHAHNAGEYIYPCLDSVLEQTFRDFKYVIVDNASSDGTKEVLEAYAKKDSRICLYRNEDNSATTLDSLNRYVDTEYFMILDHDDYLEKDALELLYKSAEEENLDMVFGRCEMVDAKGRALSTAGLARDISCMTREGLCQFFAPLYWQMRTLWGKLIRTRMIPYIDRETYLFRQPSKYGGDTVIILSMAFAAERLGTVGKILHHYRILDKSQSRTYCRQRFMADWVLLDLARDLLSKNDGLTITNEIFLFKVYYNAVSDTLRVLMNSNSVPQEKCEVLTEIIAKENTQEMLKMLTMYASDYAEEFVDQYSKAVIALYVEEKASPKTEALMYDWIKLLLGENVLEAEEFDVMRQKYKGFMLMLCRNEVKRVYEEASNSGFVNECPELFLQIALKEEKNVERMARILYGLGKMHPEIYQRAEYAVSVLADQNALLKNTSQEIRKELPDIISAVCAGEYVDALNLCLEQLQKEKWQNNAQLLLVAISLAALLEDAELFVALKKIYCLCLIRGERYAEAEEVLSELEEMCPGDAEVEELKSALRKG